MAQVKDPVCGMMVDTESAAYSNFMGTLYYFCTPECREVFGGDPSRYVAKDHVADGTAPEDPGLEKHEPPFTKKGPIVAPKFGSAGSGGLEFEPGPERHGKDPNER